MKTNKEIWKEVLFIDIVGMPKHERYQTIFVVFLYLPFVIILFPILALKDFYRRKHRYSQKAEWDVQEKINL